METLKELETKLKEIREEQAKEEAYLDETFRMINQLEEKYGTPVSSWYDCGQGSRGYHYEYTEENWKKKKEEEERIRKERNLVPRARAAIYEKYRSTIQELEDKISYLKYGMSERAYDAYCYIQQFKEEIAELEEAIARKEKIIEEEAKKNRPE